MLGRFLVSGILLITMAVQAEASKDVVADKTSAVKTQNTAETIDKPADESKQKPKKNSATSKKNTSSDNQTITDLNLALPKNLDEDTTAISLENMGQSLPDLFAPVSDDGRVSVAGGLLVEEDLELNPGSGLDNDGSNSRDDNKEQTDILDDVEGAQLNFRVKID